MKTIIKTRISLGLLAILLCTTLSSCYRSRCEVWEDTKTCGRYLKKGIGSLLGQHVDSREYASYYQHWDEEQESISENESEYVPLADATSYQQLNVREYAPISKESPGDPGSKIPGIDSFKSPSGQLAALFQAIHFETDNYSIKGENVATLREIAHYMAGHPNTYIFIEGHADERGAAAYNLALGSRRANSVRNFLVQNGVNPDQLFTISYGLEKPVAMGHDEPSWTKNRRAQFKLYDR